MPECRCGQDYATVELKGSEGRVLVCERCAAMLEMVRAVFGGSLVRRPVLGLIRGSVE